MTREWLIWIGSFAVNFLWGWLRSLSFEQVVLLCGGEVYQVKSRAQEYHAFEDLVAPLILAKYKNVQECHSGMGPRRPVMVQTSWPYKAAERIIPGFGTFWIKLEGRWCRLVFQQTRYGESVVHEYTLTVLAWRTDLVKLLRQRVQQGSLEDEKEKLRVTIQVNQHEWTNWLPKRRLSTVFYDGVHEEALRDLREYAAAGSKYDEEGRVHKRGYILHGPPGTGKTSMILWLASEMGVSLNVIRSTSVQSLVHSIQNNTLSCITVLEDIDAALTPSLKTRKNPKQVSDKKVVSRVEWTAPPVDDDDDEDGMSLLLQVLDGTLSSPGQVVVMTTNHIDRLDPALLRPGRADRIFYVGLPSPETIRRYILHRSPDIDVDRFMEAIRGLEPTIAALEGLFDRYKGEDAIASAVSVLTGAEQRPTSL